MFSFGRNQSRKIGLAIYDHVVRMVELKSGHLVRKFNEEYLPEGLLHEGKVNNREGFRELLGELIKKWEIKGRDIIFQIPDSYVVMRKEMIPSTISDDEVKSYLYLEIGSSIHLPFENPVFDFYILGENENGKKTILLFAAPESIVTEFSTLLDEVKLNPKVADISSLAIYRTIAPYIEDDSSPIMLLQLNPQSGNLGIFRDHKPEFIRQISLYSDLRNWKKETDGDQSVLTWVGDEQQLIGELNDCVIEVERIMNFYQFTMNNGDTMVTRILITGDHDLMVAKRLIQNNINIPVEILATNIKTVSNEVLPTRFSLSLGLALKEVQNVSKY